MIFTGKYGCCGQLPVQEIPGPIRRVLHWNLTRRSFRQQTLGLEAIWHPHRGISTCGAFGNTSRLRFWGGYARGGQLAHKINEYIYHTKITCYTEYVIIVMVHFVLPVSAVEWWRLSWPAQHLCAQSVSCVPVNVGENLKSEYIHGWKFRTRTFSLIIGTLKLTFYL